MEKVRGDDAQLAAMGHKAELKRNFSMLYVSRIGGYGLQWSLTILGRCWVWLLPF